MGLFVMMMFACAFADDEGVIKKVQTKVIPPSIVKTKKNVIRKLQRELNISGAKARSIASRILSNVDYTSMNASLERAKVLARKLKKEAKIAAKHTHGKICGDELIDLAKMYDNKIRMKVFDPRRISRLIDETVIKLSAEKKAREAKSLCDRHFKKIKPYEVPKPKSAHKNPFKLTLAQQYPEIARMVPETKTFVDFKAKVNAKQMLQNKVINNV